jgi:hypothetical protein
MSDEQIAAAILRTAATVSAPQALRERLAAPAPPRRAPRAPRLALGGALAAVAAALVLLVSGGSPTVQDVAAAALHAPTAPAVGTAAEWSAVGQRTDRVDGRRSVTVVYRRAGQGVHYAIVDGAPLAMPAGRVIRLGGHPYTVLRHGGATIITWRADGHTCVLASRQAGESDLVGFLRSYYS